MYISFFFEKKIMKYKKQFASLLCALLQLLEHFATDVVVSHSVCSVNVEHYIWLYDLFSMAIKSVNRGLTYNMYTRIFLLMITRKWTAEPNVKSDESKWANNKQKKKRNETNGKYLKGYQKFNTKLLYYIYRYSNDDREF